MILQKKLPRIIKFIRSAAIWRSQGDLNIWFSDYECKKFIFVYISAFLVKLKMFCNIKENLII